MERIVNCEMIVAGEAEGKVLFSDEPLSFWGGYDQETGEIIDRRHPLSGENATGRILAIPSSRGSTTTVSVLLEALLSGKSPSAILIERIDQYFTLAAVIAEEFFHNVFPVVLVPKAEFSRLREVEWLKVRADGSIII